MDTEPPASPDTESAAPEPCMACRGTGQVISHLGGEASTVTCPWCRGGGLRLADVDAQAGWMEGPEGQPRPGQESNTKPAENQPPPGGDAA